MSKGKMLEVAKELTFEDLSKEIKENQTRASEKYSGSVFIITGYIKDFNGDSVVLYGVNSSYNTIIKANMSKEEINSLDKGQQVTIVGKIDKFDFEQEKSTTIGGTVTTNIAIAEMKNAYIEKDSFEISGIVEIPDEDYILRSTTGKMSWQKHKIDEWYCCINDYDITEFAETKNFTTKEHKDSVVAGISLKDEDNITITGRIIKENHKIGAKELKYKIKDLRISKSNNEES